MTESIILHHYDKSPYAEKIRLMFGLMNTSWQSLLSLPIPPRPNLDPLTGGYRRIPVAQIGADLICDTGLIAQEVSCLTGNADLSPENMSDAAKALMVEAEGPVFFSAVAAVPPIKLIGTMIKEFGFTGTYKFVKDRTGMMKGGTTKPPSHERAKGYIAGLLSKLEEHLASNEWINGESASVADFAVYHPIWLHLSASRSELKAGPNTTRWYTAVTQLGEGTRQEITQNDAFSIAKSSTPRALPAEASDNEFELGQMVNVAPSDYGCVPVAGKLVMVSEDRIILARETQEFGTLHVHFPRQGYDIS